MINKAFAKKLTLPNNTNLRKLQDFKYINNQCLKNNITVKNFSQNDYLGMSSDPRLQEIAQEYLHNVSWTVPSSRLLAGNHQLYEVLEQKLCSWKNKEALVFGAGYQANVGILSCLLNRKSIVFIDKLAHASLIDGVILSKCIVKRYRHNDMNHLQELLQQYASFEEKMIISESVFSMDGTIAPLDDIIFLAKEYEAFVYIDDAHSSGVFGNKGVGLCHNKDIDIVLGTFSKSLASYGSYVTCSNEIKQYLINRCRSLIYTTCLPPSLIALNIASVVLVTDEAYEERRTLLQEMMNFVEEFLQIKINSPIIPLIVNDEKKCLKIAEYLLEKGFYIAAIRPPTVPANTSRLRLSLNANYSLNDLQELLELYQKFN